MSEKRKNSARQPRNRRILLIGGAAALFGLCMCSFLFVTVGQQIFNAILQGDTSPAREEAVFAPWAADSAELTVAVSPIMAPTLQERVDSFNRQRLNTPDGKTMQVSVRVVNPDEMVNQSLGQAPYQALIPDSSLWLGQIDQRWMDQQADQGEQGIISPRRVGESVRFAVSPIVLAAWEEVARDLGWPNQSVGWSSIQRKATTDANFKWNHPNTQHAAGMLATLAEFYAGAGLTRGLTEEIATQPHVLDYVREVEATIRFYGEGEVVILQRLAQEGRNFLDLFVAQEQSVINWNRGARGNQDALVAIYPAEGTLWVDHPLALLELGGPGELAVTDNQQLTFRAFADYLRSPQSQSFFLAEGYRPADLNIALDAPGSPFANSDAVDFRQPVTTLQIPSARVVEVIQNVWWYTKRPTNVYLVVDTSGSMQGSKMENTRTALRSFITQIQGDRDRVGIVEFGSGIKHFEPLRAMTDEGRAVMLDLVEGMDARGNTALIDGVWVALNDLLLISDAEAINAVVVMTDGQENDSRYRLGDLEQMLTSSNLPIVVFTIAFGRDADEGIMREIARIGGGQFYRADDADIEELYRIISTYF